jgi:O-antigen/teichoic acid export membrane protein
MTVRETLESRISELPAWLGSGGSIVLGRGGDALLRFGIFLATARVLEPRDFALYALLTAALVTTRSIFSLASPRVALFFHSRGVRDPLFSWLFLTAGAMSGLAFGALLLSPPLRHAFFRDVSLKMLMLGMAPLPFVLLADSLSVTLLSDRRETLYGVFLWIRTLGVGLVLATSLLVDDRLTWILAGRLVVNALVAAGLAIATRARPSFRGAAEMARPALRYGMPIAVGGGFVALHRRADVFLLSAYGMTNQIGGYALCYAIAEAVWLVTDSLEAALFVDLTKRDRPGAARVALRAFRAYCWIGALALLGGLAGGEIVLTVFFGARYPGVREIFPWILTAAVVTGVGRPFSSYLYSRSRTKTLMVCHLMGLSFNLALCVLTIPRWGALGAAIASLGSYTMEATLFAALFARDIKDSPPENASTPEEVGGWRLGDPE